MKARLIERLLALLSCVLVASCRPSLHALVVRFLVVVVAAADDDDVVVVVGLAVVP